ncbi:MAG: DUF488 domain-containing protein [Tepidisphaeraceae bacterium]
MGQRTLFTVGHSTRGWDEFVALLKAWKIDEVVDVRTVPRSRAYAWFCKEQMEKSLPKAAIRYLHLPGLGGFRPARNDSVNTAWRNARFRGYADYMQTTAFDHELKKLNERRRKRRVCVMCSEAVWWRCHRRMIADVEVARGIPVKHVMGTTVAKRHEMTEFAAVQKRRDQTPVITYPSPIHE